MRIRRLLIALGVAVSASGAYSQVTGNDGSAQQNQARGYWIDPATRLMWAAKDNGKDMSWKGAGKYCHGLRLGGYSDWRLAHTGELAQLYDAGATAPGLSGPGKEEASTWHVKGNLFLTGYVWSADGRTDDRGKPSAYKWHFDFNDGRTNNDPTGWPYPYQFMRALCVRGFQD